MTVRHFTASAVVLDEDNRVLLINHNKAGLWLYPGGHVEPNESLAEAAVREVAEETGIRVVVIGEPVFRHPAGVSHPPPWAIIKGDVTDPLNGPHRHIDFIYVCRPTSGNLAARTEEVTEAQWASAADLATLPTPAEFPASVAAAVRWAQIQP